MQVYGRHEPSTMYDVEALLYVQEDQLGKFMQELYVSDILTNQAQHESIFSCDGYNFRGRGTNLRFRGF